MSGAEPGDGSPIPSLDSRTGGRRKARIQQPHKMRPWLICSGLLVAVWSFLTSLGFTPPEGISSGPEMFGFLLGGVFGAGLFVGGIVALMVHLAAGRRLTPGKGLRNFAILAAVAMLTATPLAVVRMFYVTDQAEIARQDAAIMADYKERSDAMIARLELRERTAAAQAQLLPHAVAAPGGLARARQAIEELKGLQESSERELRVLMEDVQARRMAIVKTDRDRALLTRNIEENRVISDRSLALGRRAVELRGRQLDVLARQPRGWEAQGDTIAFSRQRDLDDYNALATELGALQVEMAEIQQKVAASDEPRP